VIFSGELMKGKDTIFISCGILQEELRHLAREGLFGGNVVFLDAALHVNFDRLKARLEQALEEAQKTGAELRVIYGHCHPDMTDILDRYGAKKIEAGNCIEALVGGEEIARLDAEAKTFFLTAGWVNNVEKIFSAGRKEFNLDVSSMFAQYKRIIVFDTGVIPIDEGKVEKFSKFTGLPVERRSITLKHLLGLIEEI
jgi:hypothetical protein